MKPWTSETIAANNVPIKANFNAWFGASKVVDSSGQPMALYHGTFGDFDVFTKTEDIGFHFGTATAANDRLNHAMKKRKIQDRSCSVIPVFVRIENPAVVSDLCVWSATCIAKELLEKNCISKEQAQPVLQGTVSQNRPQPDRAFYDHLVKALEANGYDGLKYRNLHEGKSQGIKSRDLSEFIEVVENEWYGKGSGKRLIARYRDSKYPLGVAKGNTPGEVMSIAAKVLARTKNGFDFSWIALRPSQVKHALGNSGLYNAADDDITDRRAVNAQQALDWIQTAPHKAAPHA